MKKFLYSSFIIFTINIVIGCSLNINNQSKILKKIEIHDTNCKIENDIDTHGGFLGDGEYFAKIKCSKIKSNQLSLNWKKLPLSESLNYVIQMEQCDYIGCKNFYERYSIQSIENGYYYFLDRHYESQNKYDDTNLNSRASWNFTLAIIDMDTNIIYFYELDT